MVAQLEAAPIDITGYTSGPRRRQAECNALEGERIDQRAGDDSPQRTCRSRRRAMHDAPQPRAKLLLRSGAACNHAGPERSETHRRSTMQSAGLPAFAPLARGSTRPYDPIRTQPSAMDLLPRTSSHIRGAKQAR
jgi:hypothetical protein